MHLLQICKMVLWGLFGVRSSSGSELDVKAFRPAQVFAVVLIILAIFLAILLTIVHTVVSDS